jgi:hypothetical protein
MRVPPPRRTVEVDEGGTMTSAPRETGAPRDEEIPTHGEDAPAGGDDGTAARLDADNAVEEDTIRALDPEAPSA